ncbi:hypothetical protein AAF712_013096 [Marasmius tenuissimus]|uniref:Uncharacterized protein n=1 Tax=Marasmius tenuissimus TaxID=585030 RepID=A0ABR2ZFZ7_9AGAR
MANMLQAFKLKPFDLEPVLAAWKDGPRFTGNPKKDPPVEEWLKKIKAGCMERNVPKEYWHKVGRHFMDEKARARLDELKSVMAKVHGGNYRWTWEKFKIAMRNMGWNIEDSATETIKVKSKPSLGLWWAHKDTKSEKEVEEPKPLSPIQEKARPVPKRSESSFWLGRKPTVDQGPEAQKEKTQKEKDDKGTATTKSRPPPTRSSSGFWPMGKNSQESLVAEPEQIPQPVIRPARSKSKSLSDTVVMTVREASKHPTPVRKGSAASDAGHPDETVTTVTHAPLWLINACNALDFLQTEHPKVMSTLSAILITAGTLPSIPAITAGAGGALLASGAAQAAGAIAVGVGSWLKAQQESRSGSTSGDTTPPSETKALTK